MTVSGSGRTREKDTRAPARGPFCVLGSSLAGEEDVLLQGACCPSGSLLSVYMPVARPIYAARRGDPHPFRCLRTAVHQPGACISYALSGKFGAPRQRSLCTHMPVLTDSPYLFYIRCRRSRSLVLPGSHAGGSRQIHRAGQPGGISLFLMSFWVLYERVLRGGSFLAQGKVPLAPSIRSSSHPLTFVVPSLS
mgnify:CR=1 FL=1